MRSGTSALYRASRPSPTSDGYPEGDPRVLVLRGSCEQMGAAYGALVGDLAVQTYDTFVDAMLAESDLSAPERGLAKLGLELAADWQWAYLARHVPDKYHRELRGLKSEHPAAERVARRMVTFANLPDDPKHMLWVIEDELLPRAKEDAAQREALGAATKLIASPAAYRRLAHGCSVAAAWGSMAAGGLLRASRNLDWNQNTGINAFKLVTVYEPAEGEEERSYATFGFAGMVGALAGLSADGLAAGEAGVDVRNVTFRGFPWTLRMRHVLGSSGGTLDGAMRLWNATENTAGFFHLLGSAQDNEALALETMAGYTAQFGADDPRERALRFPAEYGGGPAGAPMADALWRSNNPYDPAYVAAYTERIDPSTGTFRRYGYMSEAMHAYRRNSIPLGVDEMINVTAIAADTGLSTTEEAYTCVMPGAGSNVLSVVFEPSAGVAHVAWESANGTAWLPAACSPYVAFDLGAITGKPWGSKPQATHQ